MTCFQQGFIAQSVEHHTSIAEVIGLNPLGASEFFLGFICKLPHNYCKDLFHFYDVGMLNTVKTELADISSISALSEQFSCSGKLIIITIIIIIIVY